MPSSLAVLWYCGFVNERELFCIIMALKVWSSLARVYILGKAIEWLSQQTGALEAGPAMACQYCSAMAEVCSVDQVWIVQLHGLPGLELHMFSGLSTGWRISVMAAGFTTNQLKSSTKFWLLPRCILGIWTSMVSCKYRDISCSFWNVTMVLALRKINVKAPNNS